MDLESPKVEDQAPQRHEAILSVVTLAAEKFLRESTLDNNKIIIYWLVWENQPR